MASCLIDTVLTLPTERTYINEVEVIKSQRAVESSGSGHIASSGLVSLSSSGMGCELIGRVGCGSWRSSHVSVDCGWK